MKDKEAEFVTAAVVASLKNRREEKGLSVNKLAELAGVSHVAVLKLERGDRTPMLRTVLKLASVLDIKLSKVLEKLNY